MFRPALTPFHCVDLLQTQVAKRFTHLGQLKGSKGGYMIKGDPIYSLTANNDGLMVRFSNLESIEDFHPGFKKHLSWSEATGRWVHVKITTVFGKSMKVLATHLVSFGVGRFVLTLQCTGPTFVDNGHGEGHMVSHERYKRRLG